MEPRRKIEEILRTFKTFAEWSDSLVERRLSDDFEFRHNPLEFVDDATGTRRPECVHERAVMAHLSFDKQMS
jgi:hypothetical protein